MNTKLFIIASLMTLLILIGCSPITQQSATKAIAADSSAAQQPFKTIATGTTDQGDVLIELTPRWVTDTRIDVAFTANTHSVDLAQFDLLPITSLEVNGKTIEPLSAPNLRGHHASGTLVFDVPEKTSTFTITILTIPKEQERVYAWE